jgi:hypothetical protein
MPLDKRSTVMKILDDQNNLGVRADNKAVAFLTSLGLFAGFFFIYAKEIPVDYFIITLMAVYLAAAILGIYHIIIAINPRIRTIKRDDTKGKLSPHKAAFFAEINRFANVKEYKECLHEMLKDEETVLEVYCRQIFEVSRITAAKYKYAQRAVYFVMTAISAEFIMIIYVFVQKMLAT